MNYYRAEELPVSPIANLYPSMSAFLDAHVAFLTTLLQVPAAARGLTRWGLKEVRFGVDIAQYLRWLFPRARFLYLLRDPYACWASFVPRGERYVRFPDRPIDAPEQFGRHWRSLMEGVRQRPDAVAGLLLRYEDLCEPSFDPRPVEQYLGVPLDLSVRAARVGASVPVYRKDQIERLAEVIEPLAGELGYRNPEL